VEKRVHCPCQPEKRVKSGDTVVAELVVLFRSGLNTNPMSDSDDVPYQYRFSEPIDLPAKLEPVGIQFLPVGQSRVIVIFSNGILDLECTEGTISQITRPQITVFELPTNMRIDDRTEEEVTIEYIEKFLDQLTFGTDIDYENEK